MLTALRISSTRVNLRNSAVTAAFSIIHLATSTLSLALTPAAESSVCQRRSASNLGHLCSRPAADKQGDQLVTSSRSAYTMASAGAPVIIQPTKQHTATVIFLHGLGDSGNGWSPVFQNMVRSPHIKYICPHAPTRPVTINMGMQMPAWFDITGLTIDSPEDEVGINESAKIVHEMMDAEMAAGIASDRILIGGFSMGGALALYCAFTYPHKLAGVAALSAFMVQRQKIAACSGPNREISIFQGHGDVDPLVALPFAQATHSLIKKFNPNASFKLYSGMGHSACDAELKDVKEFLEKQLPGT